MIPNNKIDRYSCTHCKVDITNEACITWKKADPKDVASKPYHNTCGKEVGYYFWLDIPWLNMEAARVG